MVILISGCGHFRNDKDEPTGKESVDFKIVLPTKDIYDNPNYKYSFVVELENKGKFDVAGTLSVFYLPDEITLDQSIKTYTIGGVDYPGEIKKQRLIFNFYTKPLTSTKQIDTQITVLNCFDYVTELNEVVCIDALLDTEEKHKVCEVKDIATAGQAAPISINKIEVTMLPIGENSVQPMFVVHIDNPGKGDILPYGTSSSVCMSGTIGNPVISIEANLDGHIPLNCQPSQLIYQDKSFGKNIVGKENKIICVGPTFQQINEEHFLNIKLYYGYMQKKKEDFKIMKLIS